MKRQPAPAADARRISAALLHAGLLAGALSVALSGCDRPGPAGFPGYAEAEYVHVAAPAAGQIVKLGHKRGDTVKAGDAAFVLDQVSEDAARREAAFRVERLQAELADLTKGRRPDELAAVRAQIAQAEAALALSQASLARDSKLVAERFLPPARLDEVRAAVKRDEARVNELRAQLRIASTGARPDQIAALQNEVRAQQAQLAQASWRLGQKTQRIPVDATVVDTVMREGEWVPAGGIVLTLLPAANVKARFFVPESILGKLRIGQQVSLRCDGCPAALPATISYIAREAEYTTPLIYSRENRSSLVFLIEARPLPDAAVRLHPGQPLEVMLSAPATQR